MREEHSKEVSRRDFVLGFGAGSTAIGLGWFASEAVETIGEDVGESLEESDPAMLPDCTGENQSKECETDDGAKGVVQKIRYDEQRSELRSTP